MNSRFRRPVCGSEGFGEDMAKCTGQGVLVPGDGIRPVALSRLLHAPVKEKGYAPGLNRKGAVLEHRWITTLPGTSSLMGTIAPLPPIAVTWDSFLPNPLESPCQA